MSQRTLPSGPGWEYECKFDGYRSQLHVDGQAVTVYSRNGHDWTRRFPTIVAAARDLPVRSAIIDGEIVIDGDGGRPDFIALHRRRPSGHAMWAFDLLAINGRDLRELPYSTCRNRLERLIEPDRTIRLSARFDDGEALLGACAQYALEGVIAKRVADPYKSGKSRSWVKVKTKTWLELNRERHRLFAFLPMDADTPGYSSGLVSISREPQAEHRMCRRPRLGTGVPPGRPSDAGSTSRSRQQDVQ